MHDSNKPSAGKTLSNSHFAHLEEDYFLNLEKYW